MDDKDILTMPMNIRIEMFHKVYIELAHKYGVDFIAVLKHTPHSIEANLAYTDLLKSEKQSWPGGQKKLPN